MKKPPTGEPYAGKPPVRFGGRGRREPTPTPIKDDVGGAVGIERGIPICSRSFESKPMRTSAPVARRRSIPVAIDQRHA